jgi:hypothetical protein
MRSINSFILFGIRKKCLINGRSLIVPIWKEDDKTDFSNYHGITTANFLKNCIQYLSLNIKSIKRRNCCKLSVLVLTQQINY